MYRQQISQKVSGSVGTTPKNQDIAPSQSYGSLSSVVQRVQQDPKSLGEDERQQLESAIGSRSTKEILAGKQTQWIPEFQGISAQLWGDSGQVDAPIQAKLTIGQVGDKYEQEADRVAKNVVQQINAPQTKALQKEDSAQIQPNTLQSQQIYQGELQLKQLSEMVRCREVIAGGEASRDLARSINSAKGGGQPLNVGLQQSMGQAMGTDFSRVRVHTDAQADQLNQSIQSKAFTTGQNIFFRQGEYNPGSQEGQELIAHELTHVIQQTGHQQPLVQRKIEKSVLYYFEVGNTPGGLDHVPLLSHQEAIWRSLSNYFNKYPVGTNNKTLQQEYQQVLKAVGNQATPLGTSLSTLYNQIQGDLAAKNTLISQVATDLQTLADLINAIDDGKNKLPQLYQRAILSQIDIQGLTQLDILAQPLQKAAQQYLDAQVITTLLTHVTIAKLPDYLNQVVNSKIGYQLISLLKYGSLDNLLKLFQEEKDLNSVHADNLFSKMTGIPEPNRLQEFLDIKKEDFLSKDKDVPPHMLMGQLLNFGTFSDLKALLELAPTLAAKSLLDELGKMSESKNQRLAAYINSYPTTRKSALGYEIIDQTKGKAIQDLIEKIRQEQSLRKQKLESQLANKLGPLQEASTDKKEEKEEKEQQRIHLIKEHAIKLQPIGLSLDRLKNDRHFTSILKENGLIFDQKTNTINTHPGNKVIVKLYSGEAAFEDQPFLKADSSQGIYRDVYRKRGKQLGKNNEYVKDDQEVFTRRYAYVEKSNYQFRNLAHQGISQGRYPTDPIYPTPPAYNAISPGLRQQIPQLPDKKEFTNAYQLVYVHQELGSGPEQRGISATATTKQVYSNQGVSFKTQDGVRFEVDLARIPFGQADNLPEVINHYSVEAQKKSQDAIGNYAVHKENPIPHKRTFDHYQSSVIKNREIFIKELRPKYLTSVNLHQPATGGAMTQNQANGFTLTDIQTMGQSVGVPEYILGFWNACHNLKSQIKSIKKDYQKYYQEGDEDGQEYHNGYLRGKKAKHNQTPPKDSTPSYKQGFWDGYYRRKYLYS
jgi:hypothetical protein